MNFKNIIIPSAADACVVYAAGKLKEYITKVTGVTLGISTVKGDGNYFSIGKAADISDADYEAFVADIKGDVTEFSVATVIYTSSRKRAEDLCIPRTATLKNISA